MIRGAFVLMFATLPLLCGDPARPPRDTAALRVFFGGSCVRCHGADGSGRDSDGKRLKGADFTDVKAMGKEKDAALAKTILKGLFFGLEMPAFSSQLSEEEALRLVQEIIRKAEKGKAIAPGSGPK